MPKNLFGFFVIFLSVYGLANFYVGFRLRQTWKHYFTSPRPLIFWPLFLLLTAIFPLGRLGELFLPLWLGDKLIIAGSYWLALLYYLFLGLLLLDVLRFSGRLAGILSASPKLIPRGVLLVISFTVGLVGYGVWNARSPVVQHYDIIIPKAAQGISQLHAVMVSDIHFDKFMNIPRLSRMVDTINGLNPDIVFLPGDIIDENASFDATQKLPEVLRRLQPPLGIYAVPGNHEYISGKPELAAQELGKGGIAILRDRFIKVADSFYVVGRDDRSRERSGGRKTLAEIMPGIDPFLPVILLDHQPFDLQQAVTTGVDLQLSGHTHLGQLFPNNLITHALYETDWGYLRKNSLQVIVSCGFGTWGPPIRIGNKPEIVDITIHFVPAELGTGD
jgi:predicted MPP superfamily phosphohydrolase